MGNSQTPPPTQAGSNSQQAQEDNGLPALRLIYFDFHGRAESIRLALHIGGIPFEDVRISETEFVDLRNEGKFPFGAVPVLEVNKVPYAQSVGILRYVGRLAGLCPEDALECLAVDQVIGSVEDLIVATVPYLFSDSQVKGMMKQKLESAVYPRYFAAFERLLEGQKSGFFGPQLSIADLAVFPLIKWVTTSIVSPESLAPYPHLSKFMDAVRAVPKVKEYYSLHGEDQKTEQQ